MPELTIIFWRGDPKRIVAELGQQSGPGAHPGSRHGPVRHARPAGPDQEEVRSDELLPDEPEHQAGVDGVGGRRCPAAGSAGTSSSAVRAARRNDFVWKVGIFFRYLDG